MCVMVWVAVKLMGTSVIHGAIQCVCYGWCTLQCKIEVNSPQPTMMVPVVAVVVYVCVGGCRLCVRQSGELA
jgi:hypothetical protein